MRIKVVDLSFNQGVVGMQSVKDSGYEGVILRSGYGSSVTQTDVCFKQYYADAKAVGLLVGTYWFCYARSNEDAVEEANACNEVISGCTFELGIFYDYEEDTIDYMDRCEGSKADMTSRIQSFIERLKALGWSKVGWYSNQNCINGTHGADALDLVRLAQYPFWLAYWTMDENNIITEFMGLNIVCHQWTDTQNGEVRGVGNVDRNVYFGDIESTPQAQPTPIIAPEPIAPTPQAVSNDPYVVVSGDTLTKIANEHNTTVSELARINNIADPNKIGVGQVINFVETVTVPTVSDNIYTVVRGDCLSVIAQRFNTTVDELTRINGISNPNDIQIGQVIQLSGAQAPQTPTVPSTRTYVVQGGDCLSVIALNELGNANRYPEIMQLNGMTNDIIHAGDVLQLPC